MIQVGDKVPAVNVGVIRNGETQTEAMDTLCAAKKVVLFAVPGAFTPTCSAKHLPGFVEAYQQFTDKGVDLVACLSVNDSFVMAAWAADQQAGDITMLADGGAELTEALGLEMQSGSFGGVRSRRYAMIIEDGVVTELAVEAPKEFTVSSAEAMLARL